MKQKLLKTMLLLSALVVGNSNVWADDQTLFDVTDKDNWETSNSSYSSTIWSSNGCIFVQAANNNKGWAYVRLGGKSLTNAEAYIATTTATTIRTEQLDVTIVQAKSNSNLTINSITLYVYGSYNSSTNTYSDVVESISYDVNDYEAGTMTFEPSDDDYWDTGVYFKLVYNLSNSNKNSNYGTDVSKLVAKEYTSGGGTPTVVTPTFDPTANTYTTAQDVEIKCETDGATIHYTMTVDGSTPADPTESDATYSSAISVTKSGTKIKAKAFKDGMTASSVASATYTIKPNAPTITGGANVTITGDDGLTFYYTTNGDAPTNSSAEYTGAFTPGDCTVKAIAYDTYGNSSSVTSLKYKYMPLAPKNINSGYFEKVTDVSSLENGDAILIVNETGTAAMSTTQNSSNRAKETIEFITSGVIYAPSANVQKLVLVKKTESIKINDVDTDTDVFYFYTGDDGYLYASSSSSNQLKTEEAPDVNNNARATISISNGDATITFTGTSSHNLLKYNSTNNPPIFSCYGSGQSAVQIYKEVAHNESVTVTDAGYATLASDYALDFTGKNIDAYIAISKGDGTGVTFTQINKVPANTGVLLHYDGDFGGKTTFTEVIPVFDGVGAESTTGNKFVKGAGVAVDTDGTTVWNYILNKPDAKPIGFYKAAGQTVAKNRAYISILKSESGAGVKEFIALPGMEDDADGIQTLSDSPLKGENIYNLAGQRLQKMQKGINIVNGKKVLY